MVEEAEAESDDIYDSLKVKNKLDKFGDVLACVDLIIWICPDASKRLGKDIINTVHETCLINSDYQTHPKSLYIAKSVADDSENARISGSKMEPVTIQETDNCLRKNNARYKWRPQLRLFEDREES